MPYQYQAFGLHITSEIECPQLLAGDGSFSDVTICYRTVPPQLEDIQARGASYQAAAGVLLLDIERVARYRVSAGSEIAVEPYPQATPEDIRLFLLGSAMGALLHQRGCWPLHGSAIAASRGAVLFVGASGLGKSTLAGALQQRGYPVLSDDVSAITLTGDGLAQVWPAYPRLRLRADAAARLNAAPADLHPGSDPPDKFELPVPRFNLDPLPVAVLYTLSVSAQQGVHLQPLHGFEKIQELTTNTYRLLFMHGMQLEQQHFQFAQALARQARLVRVTRPPQPFLLDELADRIEEDLTQ